MNATNRCVFVLEYQQGVCYRVIDWKKGLEVLNEKALKRLEFVRTSSAGTSSSSPACHLMPRILSGKQSGGWFLQAPAEWSKGVAVDSVCLFVCLYFLTITKIVVQFDTYDK